MLTPQQAKTFEFIQAFIKENGFAPKLNEIAKELGIKSRSNIHSYLQALAKAGLISIETGVMRGIHLEEYADRLFAHMQTPYSCLLVGKIAAGRPIEAISSPEPLDFQPLFNNPNRFALEVHGNSMIEEGILDGDLVICEQAQTARNGQIVVALIDQLDATLKRFRKNQDQTVTLIPANASLKPVTYLAHRVQIQGIFVGLVRMQ